MRLIDHLAARRRYYRRALPTLPDILLIDIPPAFAGEGLPLDRYYPVILENDAEMSEMEAFLCEPRTLLICPGLFDRRPAALVSQEIVFALYAPPEQGWPWLLLGVWPQAYTAMVPADADMFARGAYTSEAFTTLEELAAAEALLLQRLGPHDVRRIVHDDVSGGNA